MERDADAGQRSLAAHQCSVRMSREAFKMGSPGVVTFGRLFFWLGSAGACLAVGCIIRGKAIKMA